MSKPFPELLKIGPHAMVYPIVHGSGDCAWEIRRAILHYDFDCVAVPLPESFRDGVEAGIVQLPIPSVVVQKSCGSTEYRPDAEEEEPSSFSYVPIDPCQGVIAALRVAMEERLPRKFIDLETDQYEPFSTTLPDPYALKQLSIEKFVAVHPRHVDVENDEIGVGQRLFRVPRLDDAERFYAIRGVDHDGIRVDLA